MAHLGPTRTGAETSAVVATARPTWDMHAALYQRDIDPDRDASINWTSPYTTVAVSRCRSRIRRRRTGVNFVKGGGFGV